MTWTKANCPFCSKDGKVWEWRGGGQKYVNCDHFYNDDTLASSIEIVKKEKEKIEARLCELQKWVTTSNEGILI